MPRLYAAETKRSVKAWLIPTQPVNPSLQPSFCKPTSCPPPPLQITTGQGTNSVKKRAGNRATTRRRAPALAAEHEQPLPIPHKSRMTTQEGSCSQESVQRRKQRSRQPVTSNTKRESWTRMGMRSACVPVQEKEVKWTKCTWQAVCKSYQSFGIAVRTAAFCCRSTAICQDTMQTRRLPLKKIPFSWTNWSTRNQNIPDIKTNKIQSNIYNMKASSDHCEQFLNFQYYHNAFKNVF